MVLWVFTVILSSLCIFEEFYDKMLMLEKNKLMQLWDIKKDNPIMIET